MSVVEVARPVAAKAHYMWGGRTGNHELEAWIFIETLRAPVGQVW